MRWPSDHPAVTDPALAEWAGGVDSVAPGAEPLGVLRHLVGRRVATKTCTQTHQLGVLKIFARPRARGNIRRLNALHASSIRHLVPRPLGVDASGHVSLVEWVEGDIFDQVPNADFADAAWQVGDALRVLHNSDVQLDRSWDVHNELAVLQKRQTSIVDRLLQSFGGEGTIVEALASERLVTAHRDCHPHQAVLGLGTARWIDLDDCAMAPAGLDVGNMIAHLRRDAATGLRSVGTTGLAIVAFEQGYGDVPPTTRIWEQLSLLRLCGLAESRHSRPDWALAIAELVEYPLVAG